jgi:hypothetical protein
MWCEGRIYREWTRHTGQWTKIWLDVGSDERLMQQHVPLDYAGAVPAFYEQLRRAGYADWELVLYVEPGAEHHELDWQRRLPLILTWLLS